MRFLQSKLISLAKSYKFSFNRFKSSYEGTGKSTVRVLNQDADVGLMVDGVSQIGFRLNNGVTVFGPMAIFPRSVLSWNVDSEKDINSESLSLFTVLEPKIDILIIGVGDKIQRMNYGSEIFKFMRKHRISVELLATEQAVTTFNFLNSEGRYVAGAFIPPSIIKLTDDDYLLNKMRYEDIYGDAFDKNKT